MKNSILILTLCLTAIITAIATAQIFEDPAPPPVPVARLIATELKQMINNRQNDDVRFHQAAWEMLWENDRATPQAIFDELGTEGVRVLLAGGKMVQHIGGAGEIAAEPKTAEQLLGDGKYTTTKFGVSYGNQGNVTVIMPPPEEEDE